MTPFRARLEYLAVAVAAFKFRYLPLGMARFAARVVGWLASDVLQLRRQVALDNLHAAFPEKSASELAAVYRACWRHFAQVGAEMARLPRMDQRFIDRWIDLSARSAFTEPLKQGRGVIFVSGHFGNWEWMGGAMAKIGYPVTYVVTSQANPLVDRWMDRMRISAGVEIIRRRDAIRGVLSALKRNRIVAMLSDQDAGEAGVFVPYFGRLASAPRGPALFALKTGAPIIYGSAVRSPDGRYQVAFEPLSLAGLTGEREVDEELIMKDITTRLEADVRRDPEQWLWLHRRWKSTPVADARTNTNA